MAPFCLLICPYARLIKTESELETVLSPHRINSESLKNNMWKPVCLWTVACEQLTRAECKESLLEWLSIGRNT